MKQFYVFILLTFLCFNSFGQDEEAIMEVSNKFTNHLMAGEDGEALAMCSERMQKLLTPEELGEIWTSLKDQFGSFKKMGNTFVKRFKNNHIVFNRIEFEKLPVYLKITIDSTLRVAGIYYVPAPGNDTWSRPTYVNYQLVKSQRTNLINGNYELYAELTSPRTPGPFPTIILVHGSGPNDMDESIGPNKMFKDIAYGLSSMGLAVFRYNKRSYSYASEMGRDEINVNDIVVNDAVKAVNFVKTFDEVDSNNIFVLGHSLGGIMAPEIASMAKELKGIIIAAGSPRSIEDLMIIQVKKSMERKEVVGDTGAKQASLKILEQLQMVDGDKINEGTPDTLLPFNIPASFWLSFKNYDAVSTAKKLNVPILILHGNKDQQVFDEDFKIWKDKLSSKSNVVLIEYPNLNHQFMVSKSDDPEKDYEIRNNVELKVVEDIYNWILQNKSF